jgi:hypothetical protein
MGQGKQKVQLQLKKSSYFMIKYFRQTNEQCKKKEEITRMNERMNDRARNSKH